MKTILCFLILMSSTIGISQRWSFGSGVEITRTQGKFKIPSGGVYPYKIAFGPNIGITGRMFLEYKFSNSIEVFFSPSIGNLGLSIGSIGKGPRLNMNYYDVGIGGKLTFNKLYIGLGIGHSRFYDLYFSQRGQHLNLKNYILNQNILNASWFLGCEIFENIDVHIKGCYYFKDFFATYAIDNLGRPVDVLLIRPQYLALGINYDLTQNKNE